MSEAKSGADVGARDPAYRYAHCGLLAGSDISALTRLLSYAYIPITLLIRGRQPVTPVGGAGCGARGFGLVSRAPGRPRVTVRPHYEGLPFDGRTEPDERRRKLPGSGGPQGPRPAPEARSRGTKSRRGEAPKGAPARVMDRRSPTLRGPARPQGGPRVRRSAPAPLGASPPSACAGRDGKAGDRAPKNPPDDFACVQSAEHRRT